MTTNDKILESALDYWKKGISIFPLYPNSKKPLTEALPLYNDGTEVKPSWIPFQTQRASKEKIMEWWTKYPNANIAGVMGKISGVICADQDVAKDKNGVPILDASGNPVRRGDITGFPPTLSATTWSNGKHMLYGYVESVPTKHGFRKMLDIQSNGSYIVLAPSIVFGKPYKWDLDWKEMWKTLAPFPVEVLPKLETAFAPKLDIKQLINIEQGSRNDTMYKLACSLYAKGYSDSDVVLIAGQINQTYKPPLGADELGNIFHSAKNFIASNNKKSTWTIASHDQGESQAVVACFADIQPEPISWLWPDRIALGKITMIAGDPGLGKSLITSTLAAIVSRGYKWPIDKTPAPLGDVVLLSAEDDPADTIRPRLDAADADPRRVHILKFVQVVEIDGKRTQRMFSLERDIAVLESLLPIFPECRLLIVDPISAYLGNADSYKNSDIRGLLAPLAELAARFKIAVVVVSHLNKSAGNNAMYRTMGSLAFTAAARAAFVVTKDKDNPERRLILPVKNNIAKDSKGGLAYSILEAQNGMPVIAWEPDPVMITANEALAPTESSDERNATDEATDFLRDKLASGPVKAVEVIKEAHKAGINEKPLRIARERLRVESKKSAYTGGWEWRLPEDALNPQDAPSNNKGALEEAGHLGKENNKEKAKDNKTTDIEWFESLPTKLNKGVGKDGADDEIRAEDIPF